MYAFHWCELLSVCLFLCSNETEKSLPPSLLASRTHARTHTQEEEEEEEPANRQRKKREVKSQRRRECCTVAPTRPPPLGQRPSPAGPVPAVLRGPLRDPSPGRGPRPPPKRSYSKSAWVLRLSSPPPSPSWTDQTCLAADSRGPTQCSLGMLGLWISLQKKTASALACLSLVSCEPLVLKLLTVATHYGLLQHLNSCDAWLGIHSTVLTRLLAPIAGRTAKLGYNPVHPSLSFCL